MNRILKAFLSLLLIVALSLGAVSCDLSDIAGLLNSGSADTDNGNANLNGNGETIENPGSGNGDNENPENPGSGNGDNETPKNPGSGSEDNENPENPGSGSGDNETPENPGSGNGDNENPENPGSGSEDNETPENPGSGNGDNENPDNPDSGNDGNSGIYVNVNGGFTVPAFSGEKYYVINDNKPFFTDDEIVTQSYERYYARDALGRVTLAMACIGKDIMPTEERESISEVEPTGWVQAYYSPTISGGYLYNRCHLIAFQLTGENANRENLITGTAYMNKTMIPFENQIADHIKEENDHVMYRITPVFTGDNLLADGILLEAYSVEDGGEAISFNMFIYNVQPGVIIDYATGNSALENPPEDEEGDEDGTVVVENDYVLNTNSKVIHKPDCYQVDRMSPSNKQEYTGNIQDLLDQGYRTGGCCHPD